MEAWPRRAILWKLSDTVYVACSYIASYFQHTEYAHAHACSHVTRIFYVRIEIKCEIIIIINAITKYH